MYNIYSRWINVEVKCILCMCIDLLNIIFLILKEKNVEKVNIFIIL